MFIFTRIISLLISIVMVCAIFYNVFSTYVIGNKNILLFKSDPFNFQSRIKYLNSVVTNSKIDPTELETLLVVADAGTKLEPINARILALKGAILQQADNDSEAAQQYYEQALALKPTDKLAITQRYIYLVGKNKFKEAIPLIEIISARWFRIFTELLPTTPLLLQTQENIDDILKRFNGRLIRLNQIVDYLCNKSGQVDLAYKLILEVHNKYKIDVHPMLGTITRHLLKQNRNSDAYLLFYKTLFEEEKKNIGYVFNSKFSSESTAYNFDWNIRPQAGVNMRRVDTRTLNSGGSEQTKLGGLEIKFLNAPVAFSNVSQLLYLPQRTYDLTVKYSIDDIRGPKPISVKLLCTKTNSLLAEIVLSKIKTTEEVKEVEFVVPEEGCELQKVLISNNNRVESWQNRFSGKVTLHEISIKLPGS